MDVMNTIFCQIINLFFINKLTWWINCNFAVWEVGVEKTVESCRHVTFGFRYL